MKAPFRAFVVDQTDDGFQMGIQHLEQRDLPPGDVLIQVAYAAVNYKDALVCIPNGNVARTYPLVPGLELTGVVIEASDPRFDLEQTRRFLMDLHPHEVVAVDE